MVTFASTLASQIGSLIASLNPTNSKTVAAELSQLTELYGSDGSLILLRTFLEQVDVREGNTRHSQLKLQLFTLALDKLLELPNFATLLNHSLQHIKSSGHFVAELLKALKLPTPRRVALALALTEAEDSSVREEGVRLLEAEVAELTESLVQGLPLSLLQRLLLYLRSRDYAKVDVPACLKDLSYLQHLNNASLPTLAPVVHDEIVEVNCLRIFDNASATFFDMSAMGRELVSGTHPADVMEELGYECTASLQNCMEVFSQFISLSEEDVACIVGMVARTHTALEDGHGSQGTLSAALGSGLSGTTSDSGPQSQWNVEILLKVIQQVAPVTNWAKVVEHLDHEKFALPDHKAFTILLSIYHMASKDPFPLQAVCGRIWNNVEGQLSFLRYGTAAPPEVFTFAHSSRTQPPVDGLHGHKSPLGTPNQAWLSLDLLEILCRLAEAGHVAAVRSILDYPLKHCPEVLLLGLAQVKTEWNLIQSDILSMLLPTYLANNPNSSTVLHQLWQLNRESITKAMVDVHSKDSSQVSRILDVCQDLKVLSQVLDSTPFAFAIDLAALASRREYLNLEKWLQDMINIHRDSIFQACLTFLKERTVAEPRPDGPGGIGQRSSPINLSLETTAIFFRVLQNNSGFLVSRELTEEMKRLWTSALRANPRLHSIGNPEQVTTEVFASDIEEEANSYFQKIYVGQLAIEDVVDMLKRFNRSATAREQEIFACMIQSLFDEYRFFSRYPDRELLITSILFGSLIKHQLVSSITLGIALRCVLDALRKPLDSKMIQFGLTALEQFKDRLAEWPQYCNHILQIPHIRDARSDLTEFIERTLNRFSGSQTELPLSTSSSLEQQQAAAIQALTSSIGLSSETGESSALLSTAVSASSSDSLMASQSAEALKMAGAAIPTASQDSSNVLFASQTPVFPVHQMQPAKEGEKQVIEQQEQAQELPVVLKQQPLKSEDVEEKPQPELQGSEMARSGSMGAAAQVEQVGNAKVQASSQVLAPPAQQSQQLQANGQPYPPPKQEMLRSARLGTGGIPTRPSTTTGFGHALNIETLVAAAEKRESAVKVPSSEVQDKVAFIINNLSISNVETKSKEIHEFLTDDFLPWFAQYMVMKRASIEPNFHDLYLKFIDKMNNKNLLKEVQKATYENCKVLLRSELIKSSSEERSLLKNLGSWMGKLTIGRNQALRAREIDPKSLIIEAYEKGLMIAIIPFTSKILEPCSSSIAYQPPNPWTMGILGLLTEIYNLPNLKMNLKFDIEVLFKNLNVDMKDVKPTQLLTGRQREIEGNPDFSNKDLNVHHQPPPPPPQELPTSTPPLPVQLEPPVTVPPAVPLPLQPPPSVAMPQPPPVASQVEVEDKSLAVPPVSAAGIDRSAASATVSQAYSLPAVPMSIPNNLAAYIVFSPKLGALSQQLQLPRIVPVAMERAIREIISPVVERSVTIACMTTRELVMKDYAMEADESRTHKAANLMVASLAGSLAHVTCKEPLRVAMANHLRSLLQAASGGAEVEQAVQLITNDNLDLGCAVIEKAATEKALRDLEENLAHPLAVRRKHRETLGAALYDASIYSQGSLARLPEALRPKPGRLAPAQQRVYEDFARLPWQNNPASRAQQAVPPTQQPIPQSGAAAPAAAAVSGAAPPAPSRMPYSVSGTQLGTGFPAATPVTLSAGQQVGIVGTGIEAEMERPPAPPASSNLPAASVAPVPEPSRPAPETATGPFSNSNVPVETAGTDIISPKLSPSSTSLDQLSTDPSLSTGEAIEKYQLIIYKLDVAISKTTAAPLATLPAEHEIRVLVAEIQEVITQCISRDEAALAIAQKVFKRLYENPTHVLHVSTHLAILESIREVCKRVVKELTNWVIYSDEDRKLNREIAVGLIQSELINLTDYNIHLSKLMDGGRNAMASDFAVHLVKSCVIQENLVSATELYNVIDSLAKIAQRPGAPESLQQLVELARNSTAAAVAPSVGALKDDKGRLAKDKKALPVRGPSMKEEGKPVARDTSPPIPAAFREQVMAVFDEWARICDTPGNNDKAYALYMSQIQHSGLLKNDEVAERFFRTLMELSVNHCLGSDVTQASATGQPNTAASGLSFTAVDMYARLVLLLVKYYADPGNTSMSKINLLNKVLMVAVKVVLREADEKKTAFNSKPFFRLFVTWLTDFNSPDPILDSSNFQVLTGLATAFQALQPLRVPAFSFAWLELVSHRAFMPKLLFANQQKGWPWFQRLLVSLFKFMEPYLRNAELSDAVRLLYKGTLRVLLVLLHDFPEFLCDHHFSFCDVIPPSCIQMRNLILSAFPRNMRLPDPFTPNLKVDLLPEISQQPRILSDVEAALRNKQLKSEVDEYLKTREPLSFLAVDLKQRLMLPQAEAVQCGTRYNVPLINALVLSVGMQAIQQLQSKSTPQQLAVPTAPITHSAPMDIFQRLITDLDTEGRYLFLNAIANQLRYPNNHTHYFSCVLLYLFAEAQQEIIQEQITRVLLERLIVNRPHPWGLLITFIELIKNPRYNFWSHNFTRCAPEIEKLFESVARSCMGPPPKSEDEMAQGMAADQLKL